MQPHPVSFETIAPSLQGPIYLQLVSNGKLLKVGSEFNLSQVQVKAWIAILQNAEQRMETSAPALR